MPARDPLRWHAGIQWERLPQELGFGSGMTCRRRLRDWSEAGVWDRLHQVVLTELHQAGKLDWSRAVIDGSHRQARRGAPKPGRARSTAPDRARNGGGKRGMPAGSVLRRLRDKARKAVLAPHEYESPC